MVVRRVWRPKLTLNSGRSLRSCELVFDELGKQDPRQRPPYLHGLLPRGDPYLSSIPPPGSQVPQKRPLQQGEPSTSIARPLAPRASGGRSNGEGSLPPQPSPGDTTGEPPRKKRGRPSKAELDSRRAAAEARGEVYQPPKRRTAKKPDQSAASASAIGGVGVAEAVPPPVAPAAAQTPTRPPTEPASEGSSGKRKRQRAKVESQELSKMQIPAVLSSEAELSAVSTVANPAPQHEAIQGFPSTIPETQFGHKASLEGLLKGGTDQAGASLSSNPDVQMKGTEYTQSSGTVQPLSGGSNETQQK